jgi:hypothetical protein
VENNRSVENRITNHAGLVVGLINSPFLIYFAYIGKDRRELSASIYLAMMSLAICLCWDLRTRGWFWLAIASLVISHLALIFVVPLPQFTFTGLSIILIGLADVLFDIGTIRLVESCIGERNGSSQKR